jgi:hypothetical protein
LEWKYIFARLYDHPDRDLFGGSGVCGIKHQFQTMIKWFIALFLFSACTAISWIFADRAGPEGIAIDHQYYRLEDVAYVELYLKTPSYYDENKGKELPYYNWLEVEVPNRDFTYTLVMRNGACINVFNWLQLSHLVELDLHVRKLGIKVVNGRGIASSDDTRLEELHQQHGELVKIEQGAKTVKVIYEDGGDTDEEENQVAKIDSNYKEKYTAVFTGGDWNQAALTAEQRQMLKSIFTR